MSSQSRRRPGYEIPQTILAAADTVFRTFLSGHVDESRRLRRNLIRRIQRLLDNEPGHVRLWCMLGDLYTSRHMMLCSLQRALRVDPYDAEANAEIARIYAEKHDKRYARHFDCALRNCRGVDIEESVIYAALEAAREAGDEARVARAMRLGRNRFPDSSLFAPDNSKNSNKTEKKAPRRKRRK